MQVLLSIGQIKFTKQGLLFEGKYLRHDIDNTGSYYSGTQYLFFQYEQILGVRAKQLQGEPPQLFLEMPWPNALESKPGNFEWADSHLFCSFVYLPRKFFTGRVILRMLMSY